VAGFLLELLIKNFQTA